MKTEIKKRTIDELRQVKDTNYIAPLSHVTLKEKKDKESAIYYLGKAHSFLVEEGSSATNQYVLSSISHLVDLLQSNSNEKG